MHHHQRMRYKYVYMYMMILFDYFYFIMKKKDHISVSRFVTTYKNEFKMRNSFVHQQ